MMLIVAVSTMDVGAVRLLAFASAVVVIVAAPLDDGRSCACERANLLGRRSELTLACQDMQTKCDVQQASKMILINILMDEVDGRLDGSFAETRWRDASADGVFVMDEKALRL